MVAFGIISKRMSEGHDQSNSAECEDAKTLKLFFAVTRVWVSLPSAVPLLCHPLKKRCGLC